ncbi:Hypothetical protein GLP15_4716 [Giardia lamblia P15]|uniref:Cilia- and flagella-associated protein 263 n=1 Tax=Giardia intestinalis (strain P15) TaxID=658858 RepID=E1F1P2_GIAIA|nr:Hypothetical protein GLP15_4716 [Giardia lamblia P15]
MLGSTQAINFSEKIDELIQANEMIMKENDLLVSFIERHQSFFKNQENSIFDPASSLHFDGEEDALTESAGDNSDTLTMKEKVLIAICESEELKSDAEIMRNKGTEITLTLKAFTISAETKLSEIKRWLFAFRRDVLADPQAALTIGDQVYLTIDDTGDVIASKSPSPKTRSRSPSPGRVKSPVRVHAQVASREGAVSEPDVEAKSTAPTSPTKSPSGSPSKPSTQVGARQFSIPTKVSAFKLNSFYSDVIGKITTDMNNMKARIDVNNKQIKKLQKQLEKQTEAADQMSSIDFDQLAIANSKYLEKIAAKNQELLRLKLTSGNTTLALNTFKSDLNKITEEKEFIEKEIFAKRTAIDKISAQINDCKKQLGIDRSVLKKLRQNEIASGDGPASIDFISLIATQDSLQKAIAEYTRKVSILERTLFNLQRDVTQGQSLLSGGPVK